LFANFGTDNGPDSWASEDAGWGHLVMFTVNSSGGDVCLDTCGPETTLPPFTLVGHVTHPSTSDFQTQNRPVSCDVSVDNYNENTVWPVSHIARTFQVIANSPFTLTFTC